MSDSDGKLECVPPPPPREYSAVSVPVGSVADIGLRVAALSDALHDPDGALARMERRIEAKAEKRHLELVEGFTALTNHILELKRVMFEGNR